MGYPSAVVANWFIQRSLDQNIELTPMKLQKLMYYAHGANLAVNDEPLLSETIEAWRYGPVIRSIYNAVKQYGNEQIPEILKIPSFENHKLTQKELTALDSTWNMLGEYSAIQLANMTHTPGAPWDTAMKLKQSFIDNNIINDYFSGKGQTKAAA